MQQMCTIAQHDCTNSNASRFAEKTRLAACCRAALRNTWETQHGVALSAKPCEAPAPRTCRARRAGPAGCAPNGGAARRRSLRRLITHRGRLSSAQAGSVQDHVQHGDARRKSYRCGRAQRALPRALRALSWSRGAGRLQADGVRVAVSPAGCTQLASPQRQRRQPAAHQPPPGAGDASTGSARTGLHRIQGQVGRHLAQRRVAQREDAPHAPRAQDADAVQPRVRPGDGGGICRRIRCGGGSAAVCAAAGLPSSGAARGLDATVRGPGATLRPRALEAARDQAAHIDCQAGPLARRQRRQGDLQPGGSFLLGKGETLSCSSTCASAQLIRRHYRRRGVRGEQLCVPGACARLQRHTQSWQACTLSQQPLCQEGLPSPKGAGARAPGSAARWRGAAGMTWTRAGGVACRRGSAPCNTGLPHRAVDARRTVFRARYITRCEA